MARQKLHGNTKVDWARVERLKDAGGKTWEQIAKAVNYDGTPMTLKSSYHSRKQMLAKRYEKTMLHRTGWPKIEKCPNRKSSWGPGFAWMNVKESTRLPIFVGFGDRELFSAQPSSAGML